MTINDYINQIACLEAGVHLVLPPDCRGDGHDVACLPREDLAESIRRALPVGGMVDTIRANGFVCGYQISIPGPDNDEIVCLCQHSGSHGPWYHQSLYRRSPETASGYVFVERLGGHYNDRRARESGLPIGRPDRRSGGVYAY